MAGPLDVPPDALLVRFRWPGSDPSEADPSETLRALLAGDPVVRDLRVFRALETDEGHACVDIARDEAAGARLAAALRDALRNALPGAEVLRLAAMTRVAGASAGEAAPWHYVVETDVQPGCEEDFNAWYEQEHLPGLASVPGTVRAMRYRNVDGHPRYRACYDLVRAEILGSPPWLAVRATPWSGRVRPTFVNTRRTMFRRA